MSYLDDLMNESYQREAQALYRQQPGHQSQPQQPQTPMPQTQIDPTYAYYMGMPQGMDEQQPPQEQSGGLFNGFFRGAKSGGAGVIGGQAGLGNLYGVGDGATQQWANEVAQNNARKKEYGLSDMLPFSTDYWTNGEGFAYDLGNALGSSAVLGAETAAVLSGAGAVAGALGIGTTGLAGSIAAASGGRIGLQQAGKMVASMGAGQRAAALGRYATESIAGKMAQSATKAGMPTLAKVLNGPMGQLYALNILRTPFEVSSEMGNAGQDALKETGGNYDEARKRAWVTGAVQAPLLALSNTLESSNLGGLLSKDIAKMGGKGKFLQALGGITQEAFQNAWEEGMQQSSQEYAAGKQSLLGVVNPFQWSPEAQMEAAVGFTSGLGLGGGGAMMNSMAPKKKTEAEKTLERIASEENVDPQIRDAINGVLATGTDEEKEQAVYRYLFERNLPEEIATAKAQAEAEKADKEEKAEEAKPTEEAKAEEKPQEEQATTKADDDYLREVIADESQKPTKRKLFQNILNARDKTKQDISALEEEFAKDNPYPRQKKGESNEDFKARKEKYNKAKAKFQAADSPYSKLKKKLDGLEANIRTKAREIRVNRGTTQDEYGLGDNVAEKYDNGTTPNQPWQVKAEQEKASKQAEKQGQVADVSAELMGQNEQVQRADREEQEAIAADRELQNEMFAQEAEAESNAREADRQAYLDNNQAKHTEHNAPSTRGEAMLWDRWDRQIANNESPSIRNKEQAESFMRYENYKRSQGESVPTPNEMASRKDKDNAPLESARLQGENEREQGKASQEAKAKAEKTEQAVRKAKDQAKKDASNLAPRSQAEQNLWSKWDNMVAKNKEPNPRGDQEQESFERYKEYSKTYKNRESYAPRNGKEKATYAKWEASLKKGKQPRLYQGEEELFDRFQKYSELIINNQQEENKNGKIDNSKQKNSNNTTQNINENTQPEQNQKPKTEHKGKGTNGKAEKVNKAEYSVAEKKEEAKPKGNASILDNHPFVKLLRKLGYNVYTDQEHWNESNAGKKQAEILRNGQNGVVYGAAEGDNIYLNPNGFMPDTPIHEYIHLWVKMIEKKNPELWAKGKELLKQTNTWQAVINDPYYKNLKDENRVASEVLSRIGGERGTYRRQEMIDSLNGLGETNKGLIQRIINWIGKLFFATKKEIATTPDLEKMTVWEFVDQPINEIFQGLTAEEMQEQTKGEAKGKEEFQVTSGSFFSGGGLVDYALKSIIDGQFAVENNPKLKGVYEDNNGQHMFNMDVREFKAKDFKGKVDYFHASPVCKNYSKAKSDAEELPIDKATAQATAKALKEIRPRAFTLENVPQYRNSEAMKMITDALDELGYNYDVAVYDSADYGAATSRKRLMLRALRDEKLPAKPQKTERSKGWYNEVKDIVATLPEASVPSWMQERLAPSGIDINNLKQPLLVLHGNKNGKLSYAYGDDVAPALLASDHDQRIFMPDGRVLRGTPRVMARISGLDDNYKLPKQQGLGYSVVGNGVPVKLTQAVYGPLLKQIDEDGGKNAEFSINVPIDLSQRYTPVDFRNLTDKIGDTSDTGAARASVIDYIKKELTGKDFSVNSADLRLKYGFDYVDKYNRIHIVNAKSQRVGMRTLKNGKRVQRNPFGKRNLEGRTVRNITLSNMNDVLENSILVEIGDPRDHKGSFYDNPKHDEHVAKKMKAVMPIILPNGEPRTLVITADSRSGVIKPEGMKVSLYEVYAEETKDAAIASFATSSVPVNYSLTDILWNVKGLDNKPYVIDGKLNIETDPSKRYFDNVGNDNGQDNATEFSIDSPKFKKWFGNSILKDKDGKPQVFYRGIDGKYDVGKQGEVTWITEDKDQADDYAGTGKEHETLEVYARVEHPIYLGNSWTDHTVTSVIKNKLYEAVNRSFLDGRITAEQGLALHEEMDELIKKDDKQYKPLFEIYNDVPEILDFIKRAGYDAIKVDESGHTTYGVIGKSHVKSATNNNGNYDANNDHIEYQVAKNLNISQDKVKQIATEFQIAYHGTPFNFNAFSLKHLMSGEGAIAHGWGLYFAYDKNVSEERYAKELSKTVTETYFDGKKITAPEANDEQAKIIHYLDKYSTIDEAIQNVKADLESGKAFSWMPPRLRQDEQMMQRMRNAQLEDIKILEKYKDRVKLNKYQGSYLYTVDIPEADTMLIEQAPFSKQPKVVQKAIKKILGDISENKTAKELIDDFAKEYPSIEKERDLPPFIQTKRELQRFANELEDIGLDASDTRYDIEHYDEYVERQKNKPREKASPIREIIEGYYEWDVYGEQGRIEDELESLFHHIEELANEGSSYPLKVLGRKLQARYYLENNVANLDGEDYYKFIGESLDDSSYVNRSKAASLALNKEGVTGIDYDGGRDGHCAVVFDDKAVKILNKHNLLTNENELTINNQQEDNAEFSIVSQTKFAKFYSKAQKEAIDKYLSEDGDTQRIAKLLSNQELKDTPWAKQTYNAILWRMAARELIAGREPKFKSALSVKSTKKAHDMLLAKGVDGALDYVVQTQDGFIGHPEKPTNAVNASYLNCNPSIECAKFCYAAKGRNYAVNINKQELVNFLIEEYPVESAKRVAAQYKFLPEFDAQKALRILDKGDISEKWLPFIKEVNKQGIRLQIFSKRAELLSQIDKQNVVMLSVDSSNYYLADKYKDLPLAFVWRGPEDNAQLEHERERFEKLGGVILPVRIGQAVLSKEKVAQLPKWAQPYTCPIDKGVKKMGKWNCTKCDKNGGVGCFFGKVTSKVMESLAELESRDAQSIKDIIQKHIDEIADYYASKGVTIDERQRQQLFDKLDGIYGDSLGRDDSETTTRENGRNDRISEGRRESQEENGRGAGRVLQEESEQKGVDTEFSIAAAPPMFNNPFARVGSVIYHEDTRTPSEKAADTYDKVKKAIKAQDPSLLGEDFNKFIAKKREQWIDKFEALNLFDDALSARMKALNEAPMTRAERIHTKVQMIQNCAAGVQYCMLEGGKEDIKILQQKYHLPHEITFQMITDKVLAASDQIQDFMKKTGAANPMQALDVLVTAEGILEDFGNLKDENAKALADWEKGGRKGEKPKPREYRFPEKTLTGPDGKPLKDANGNPITVKTTYEDYKAVVAAAPQALKRCANDYYKFNNNLLHLLWRTGVITEKEKNTYEAKYKKFCPLMRNFKDTQAMDAHIYQVVSGKGPANVNSPLKHRSGIGSTREVLSPVTSTVVAVQQYAIRAERNVVANDMVKTVEKYGLDKMMHKLPNETEASANTSTVAIRRNGEKEVWYVNPELYPAITGAFQAPLKLEIAPATAIAQALRVGATTSPGFIVRNLIKDTVTAGITSHYGFIPFYDSVRGAMRLLNDEKFRAKFYGNGVVSSSQFADREAVERKFKEMTNGKGQEYSLWDLAKSILKYGWGKYSSINELIEASTRAGLMIRAEEANQDVAEQTREAVYGTINWFRSGTAGQQVNRVIPFFNACIQGGDLLYQEFKENPQETMLKIGKYILAPTLVLWLANHDEDWYKELDPSIKQTCWCLPGGIRIPKPQEAGIIFGSGLESLLEIASQNDPKAFNAWKKAALDTFVPNFIPTAILPLIEWQSNYSFFRGKPIENQAMQKLPAEMRYGDYTSAAAINLGKATGLSPVKLENMWRSVTGTMGMFALQSFDLIDEDKSNLPAKYLSEMPIAREFYINGYNLNRTQNDFFELTTAAEQQHRGHGKPGKPTEAVKGVRQAQQKVQKAREMRREVQGNNRLTPIQKRVKINQIDQDIKRIEQTAIKKYGKYFDY